MAYQTHDTLRGFGWIAFPVHWVEAALDKVRRHGMYRQTLAELSSLSDRQLADLGLNRSALRRVAREAILDAR